MKSAQEPRIIKALMNKPHTATELSVLIHSTKRSAQMIVARLYREGKVFIQEWHLGEYRAIPAAAYRYGIGVDAERPKPTNSTERQRKYRENETPEHRAFRLARQRQLQRKVKRDPLVSAFFGSASK